MKHFLTSIVFSICCLIVNAQQNRFIYLQSENKQPFFVRLDNKVWNSYPLGYLIIPKLDDGLYSLVLGFPQNSYELEFNCSVKNKDVGFIIKKAGEEQWQLFNVQTLSVIIPGDVITKHATAYEKETDPFSIMLANAVHDSTILRKDVVKEVIQQNHNDSANTIASNNSVVITMPDHTKVNDLGKAEIAKETLPEKHNEINQKDTVITVSSNSDLVISKPDHTLMSDSAKNAIAKETISEKHDIVTQQETTQTMISNDVAVAKPKTKKSKKDKNVIQDSMLAKKDGVKEVIPANSETKDTSQGISSNNDIAVVRSVIKRKLKKTGKEGIEMMYVDDNGDTKDTIRLLIPVDKKKTKDEEIKTEPVVSLEPPLQDERPKEVKDKTKTEPKISKEEKEIIKEANEEFLKSSMINSDCKNFATDADFFKIRKKMVAESSDEDMIRAARKIFKTKCFTTEQIKNLSVLFLKDEGKYMFFDAAYPFVSDSDLYTILEKQLSDNYYITRFRAMIHK